MATFSFNGPGKLITVDAEVGDTIITAAEIYSRWKDWVGAGNSQYVEAFAESVGGNSLGGGAQLDSYVFLRNDLGWRIRPDERDHTLTVDGNLFGASSVLPTFIATVGDFSVLVKQLSSSRAQLLAGTGSPTDIADAVWAHSTAADLTAKMTLASKVLRNKTITDPTTGVMTVYDDDGSSVLFTANIYEGSDTSQAYRGLAVNRRERLA